MANEKFADKLQISIEKNDSFVIAGLDPRVEDFPDFIVAAAQTKASSLEEVAYQALTSFYAVVLEALHRRIAAVKPNIAFFEQYGPAGVRAFADTIRMAKEYGLPVIADVKRGDIGTTAAAYSAAFLGKTSFCGNSFAVFDADAMTINPFLGFDTIEPFLKDCNQYGKGVFILVKTSNPGSAAIQNQVCLAADKTGNFSGETISFKIAAWIEQNAAALLGDCGYSGLGAVVGATYPEEARKLRQLMPKSFFLIPGMGAQGGSAQDAAAGFAVNHRTASRGGAVINLSRGLFASFANPAMSKDELIAEVQTRADKYNRQIKEALI